MNRRKRLRQQHSKDKTQRPAVESNNEQDEDNSTPSPTPAGTDMTDEQRLEHAKRLARNQVSLAYSAYHPPELSDQVDKFRRCMIAWKCKTNLSAHAGRCLRKQQIPSHNKTLAEVGVSGTGEIDSREAGLFLVLQRCAIWCAEGANPFSALEEPSFKKVLHPTILKHLPTQKMVSQAIHMLYLCVQEKLRRELEIHKGTLYLGVDAWQTPNGFDIIGAVIYRLSDDGAGKVGLDAMPLDFVQLKEKHTGKYLARMVEFIVEKFGLKNRICGIVSDNAANSGTMIGELVKLNWKRFTGEAQWIRCFAHILNLIVKAILQPFSRLKKSIPGASELDDSDEEHKAHDLIES
ncbi:hypothetical protein PTTG_28458 [Puccinia triticina 1-1 BBBD Race 1]|uniref:DUF659 domain-containing protein n=1 Tax=Puccinia triticina (isolate 1-1 / race 1 (BBBD)) TaxID=630390 RepID=A0A180GBD8_PUCT1|nr:hypothetical protein PTTG_28458 [Puccinia triticina 1-1 BBBD Race 1]